MVGVETVEAQKVVNSPRVAALLYAKEHGLELPRDSLLVAWESTFDMIGGGKPSPAAILEQDAGVIARAIGPKVRTASAPDFMECKGTRCATSSRYSVLLVSEAKPSTDKGKGIGVLIRLFQPGPNKDGSQRTVTDLIVDVEPSGNGWVGVRNRIEPGTTKIVFPKGG
jgi:hypothetical protein